MIPTPVWTDGLSNLKPAIGQPVPVKDDEILTDVSFATQKQLEVIGTPDLTGMIRNPDDRIVFKTDQMEEVLPTRDDFVPYDEPPVPLSECVVEYPPLAREAGIEGVVWIKALIDRNGKVRDVVVFRPSGSTAGFEESAQKAAWGIIYKPAISNRQPVAVWVVYAVSFKLK
jgi:TonB family protein